jgi:hypothetical protein
LGKNNKIIISKYIDLLNGLIMEAAEAHDIHFVNYENKDY